MNSRGKYPSPLRFWQTLFLIWLLAVNIFFYLQFRGLAASRLPHWLIRWLH